MASYNTLAANGLMLLKKSHPLCDRGHKLHEITGEYYNLLLYKLRFLSKNGLSKKNTILGLFPGNFRHSEVD